MVTINIILIGMPGCGKSTIGKRLAEFTGYEFIDTDKIIESKEGKSIKSIFKDKGESYFRQLERELISDFKLINNKIIATGGGMPIFFDNMEQLNKIGLTIFIDIPLKYIVERNKRNNKRPLLNDCADMENRIKQIYMERINVYNKCNIHILNYENSVYHMCKTILSKIKYYECK